MWDMWSKSRQANDDGADDQNDGAEKASELFEFYDEQVGEFPRLWSVITDDIEKPGTNSLPSKEKLRSIFVFFEETKEIQKTEGSAEVSGFLGQRLQSRWDPDSDVVLPESLKDTVKILSTKLAEAFSKLKSRGLVGPAFELFASGSLTARRALLARDGLAAAENLQDDEDTEATEPDSGGFFFWVEFALVAANAGFDTGVWIDVLPDLLRSERVFALTYGGPVDGVIPPERVFGDYGPPLLRFRAMSVEELQSLPWIRAKTLEELEAAQTAAAEFAFPKEFSRVEEP